jgi:hypothetical protein
MAFDPEDFFDNCDVTEVTSWNEYARYHDVHVTGDDYIITYLDPTIYTAWCLYNTQTDLPNNYIAKLKSWNYKVCYFRSKAINSEALRNSVTMNLSSDLFPDTPFTHRLIL